jgi:hypothetical protein
MIVGAIDQDPAHTSFAHLAEDRRFKAKCESSIKFHVRAGPPISRIYGSFPFVLGPGFARASKIFNLSARVRTDPVVRFSCVAIVEVLSPDRAILRRRSSSSGVQYGVMTTRIYFPFAFSPSSSRVWPDLVLQELLR